jgi:hypothetical protein
MGLTLVAVAVAFLVRLRAVVGFVAEGAVLVDVAKFVGVDPEGVRDDLEPLPEGVDARDAAGVD